VALLSRTGLPRGLPVRDPELGRRQGQGTRGPKLGRSLAHSLEATARAVHSLGATARAVQS
jgi:hypothetical protein